MGDQIRIPGVVIICFFSLPFSKVILKPAELPSLRNIVSSLYQLFVPLFAMPVFMYFYLHYRVNKQRDTSFKLSPTPWTVDLSKHLITAWIIQKFMQLDNFVTFSVFFFPLVRQSSMVKPVWAGTFGKWAIFLKETSIITGNFYL